MTSIDDDAEAPHPYFLALEDLFIRLRGVALLLPPADWQVAKQWYEAGIPIALVERTLEEIFVRRWQAGKEGIKSLRYARRKVERAWEELQKLQAPSAGRPAAEDEAEGDQGADLVERLDRLAARLPEGLADRERWVGEIGALAALEELSEAENALAELESRLLASVDEGLEEDERDALDHRLADALEPMKERLGARELACAEARLRERLVRRQARLPTLSLFTD